MQRQGILFSAAIILFSSIAQAHPVEPRRSTSACSRRSLVLVRMRATRYGCQRKVASL
jgi:hypothetical protein